MFKKFLLTALLAAPCLGLAQAQHGTISGRLLSVDGAPAANARVTALAVPDSTRPAGDAMILSIAQTDTLGRYRLENIPPGRYYITGGLVDFPSYFPGVGTLTGATVVTVGAGATIAGMDFAMARPASLRISGHVTWQSRPTTPAGPRVMMSGTGNGAQYATIAPDGRFEFSSVRPGNYSIGVNPTAPGVVPLNIVVSDKDLSGLELVVPPIVTVTGTVVVEGGGLRPRVQLAFGNAAAFASTRTTVLASGVNGTFTAQLAPGQYGVTASGIPQGYSVKSITAGSTDVLGKVLNIEATDSPQITVTLTVSSPPPWVRVSGRVTGPRPSSTFTTSTVNMSGTNVGETLSAVIDRDGLFEFPMVLPGAYTARVLPTTSAGVMPVSIAVGNKDLTDIEIAMQATKDIAGRVTVEGGGPVPHIGFVLVNPVVASPAITTTGPPGPVSFAALNPMSTVSVSPQPDGSFRMTLPEGQRQISVVAGSIPAGYSVRSFSYGSADLLTEPLKVALTDSAELRITLVAPNAVRVSVTGRVVGTLSDPSSRVSLTAAGILETLNTPINADGTFEFSNVFPGSYTARVTVPGNTAISLFSMSTPVIVADKNVSAVEVVAPKEIAGRVIVESGGPIPRFMLQAPGASGPVVSATTLNTITPQRDGTFRLGLPIGDLGAINPFALPPGYLVTSMTYGTTDLLRNPLKVAASDTAELHITLGTTTPPPWVSVSGRVVGLTPGTTGGQQVFMTGGPTAAQGATINPDGSFTFPRVLQGTYVVRLDAASTTIAVFDKDVTGVEVALGNR